MYAALGNSTLPSLLPMLPVGTTLLVPGYGLLLVEGKVVSCARLNWSQRVFRYFAYSITYFAALGVFFGNAIAVIDLTNLAHAFAMAWQATVTFVLLTPVAIGVGLSRRFNLVSRVMRRLGIPALDSIESAWEKAFIRREGCLVRLTFKNGTDRYGQFGLRSLVSADPSDPDIFLEEAFCENADGKLGSEPGSIGIWVRQSELECVRFYDVRELEKNGQEEQRSSSHSSRELRSGDSKPTDTGNGRHLEEYVSEQAGAQAD